MSLINATGSNDKELFVRALFSALSDYYKKEDPQTNLYKLYQVLAQYLSTVDIDISALKHDNFLSASSVDEIVERSTTDLDKLIKEGAFDIERIGFTSSDFVRREIHHLEVGTNTITLNYIPKDFNEVKVYNSNNPYTRIPVGTITEFSTELNTITITSIEVAADYIIEYIDVGSVTLENEKLQMPVSVFTIGWGENGFGEYQSSRTDL